ncbi:conserved hypothetical protein [Ricinus communis]|uniref:Uncharacterized protein n=1 Tax=Ricinus communis TaxID=3988 RepID=B9TDW1_RICCO|nr:conserved hypothetical protein [Ricinus communis]
MHEAQLLSVRRRHRQRDSRALHEPASIRRHERVDHGAAPLRVCGRLRTRIVRQARVAAAARSNSRRRAGVHAYRREPAWTDALQDACGTRHAASNGAGNGTGSGTGNGAEAKDSITR